MSDQPTVFLYSQDNAGLIIPWASGVIFQQQAGGYLNSQDRIEGIFVPLDDFAGHAQVFRNYFAVPKWQSACSDGIDSETADFIDSTLGTIPGHSTIKVDREKLDDSHEAWIHVFIADPESTGLLKGFAPAKAVLTWPNSD